MTRGRALLVAGGVGLLAAVPYSQRVPIERAYVDYRRPALQDQARTLLYAALDHPDKFIRIDAAGHLARFGDPRGFGVLERAMQDENAIARWSALRVLYPFEERALPLVENALHDEEVYVRNTAVSVMGRMTCAPARARLWELWNDPAVAKDTVVLAALVRVEPRRVAEIAIAEVQRPDRLTRAEAVKLWLGCRQPWRRVAGPDEVARTDAVLLPIVRAWADEGGPQSPILRQLAQAFQDQVEESADAAAMRGAPPAEIHARVAAGRVERLATRWPDAANTEALRQQLTTGDLATRERAAGLLILIPSPAAVDVADAVLPSERSERVRTPLLRFLVREAPERATPHVIATLKMGESFARSSTAETLRRFPDNALVPAYAYALRDKYGYVRLAAVIALTRTTHPDRARLLARALHDEGGEVQVRAAAGLLASW